MLALVGAGGVRGGGCVSRVGSSAMGMSTGRFRNLFSEVFVSGPGAGALAGAGLAVFLGKVHPSVDVDGLGSTVDWVGGSAWPCCVGFRANFGLGVGGRALCPFSFISFMYLVKARSARSECIF